MQLRITAWGGSVYQKKRYQPPKAPSSEGALADRKI